MAFKIFPRTTGVADMDAQPQKGNVRRRFLSLFGEKKRASKEAKKVLGGKYLSKKALSLGSLDTSESSEAPSSWKSCSSRDYKQRSQLPIADRQKEWGKAVVDARRLPGTSHFSNNHIMVNKERSKRTVPALKRSSELDSVARWHAEVMASEGAIRHSNPKELQSKLNDSGTYLGENVASGESIRVMHQEMVHNIGDIRNMTDRRYKEMGMATARGANGELYLCQIFRG